LVSLLRFPSAHLPGRSPAMTALYGEMALLARGEIPVLILGETGVGKEHVARTLHLSSSRSRGPFVGVNCAAIPADLLEAELFGIRKGVATGVAHRKGIFEQAREGTLFLDEIGDMLPALQAKVLRTLQEKQIRPVGGRPSPVDVRVISATNSDLGKRIEAGTFRQDLYYRLAGCELRIPPLRHRREDIPALVEHFMRATAAEIGKRTHGITDETLRGERPKGEERKIWDVKGAINRAFFIIFTAAATTVVAMLPLMSIIDLKGFAFTTIIGVLIGIMITRPAYARIVELIT